MTFLRQQYTKQVICINRGKKNLSFNDFKIFVELTIPYKFRTAKILHVAQPN